MKERLKEGLLSEIRRTKGSGRMVNLETWEGSLG